MLSCGLSLSRAGRTPFTTPTAPTLTDILPYNTGAKTWANILYGTAQWGAGLRQWIDVDLPVSAAPGGGYPVVMWFHPNGSDKSIVAAELVTAKAQILAAGFAFMSVEFRHPVPDVALGAPHLDAGLAIQYARGLATALNLDVTQWYGLVQSRGNLALWQALQKNRANPSGRTWAERQSSLLKGIWSYQGQTTYSTTEMANRFIISGERAAFLAANPDDERWGSSMASVPTAAFVPYLTMRHRDAYPVGLVPAASFDEHFSGFGKDMQAVYTANGYGARFTGADNITSANAFVGVAAWFTSLLAL